MARFVVAAFATVVIWLMFGGPNSFTTEAALLFMAALLSCYMVIWNNLIFQLFDGDGYTYGIASKSVAFIGFIMTLIASLRGYYLTKALPIGSGIVSPFNWIAVVLGLFVPFWLPIASRRSVTPLPRKSTRREFEDPQQ